MVYARNTAQGDFFCYNAPQMEAGFTSPLWLVLLSFLNLFTDSIIAVDILGLCLLLVLAYLAYRMAGPFAGFFILLDPLLLFSAFSGMEVVLFCIFFYLALDRFLAEKPLQAGISGALALLSRPEGVLVLVLLLGLQIKKTIKDKQVLSPLKLLLPPLIGAGLWVGFCLHVTGRPLPNTFYAKIGDPFSCNEQGFFSMTLDFFMDQGLLFPILAILLVLLALFHNRTRTGLILLLALGLIFGVWASRPMLMVESFYWERYLIPAMAGIHLILGFALKDLWERNKIIAIVLGCLVGFSLVLNLDRKQTLYKNNCRDIARFNVAAGKWLKENTEPNHRISVMDAGAIKYFSQRHCVDLAGLNNRHFTNPEFLSQAIDVNDASALARYANTEWFVLFQRHYTGLYPFELRKRIIHQDYSLYIQFMPHTLLILKKGG